MPPRRRRAAAARCSSGPQHVWPLTCHRTRGRPHRRVIEPARLRQPSAAPLCLPAPDQEAPLAPQGNRHHGPQPKACRTRQTTRQPRSPTAMHDREREPSTRWCRFVRSTTPCRCAAIRATARCRCAAWHDRQLHHRPAGPASRCSLAQAPARPGCPVVQPRRNRHQPPRHRLRAPAARQRPGSPPGSQTRRTTASRSECPQRRRRTPHLIGRHAGHHLAGFPGRHSCRRRPWGPWVGLLTGCNRLVRRPEPWRRTPGQ
jgi:hypothetical protein